MARQDLPAEYHSPVPGTCEVRFVIPCRNVDITFVTKKMLEAFRMKCQRQILHINLYTQLHMTSSTVQHNVMVSACHKRRSIRSHWLTTGYGLHQKTTPVSIRPQSSAYKPYMGDSCTMPCSGIKTLSEISRLMATYITLLTLQILHTNEIQSSNLMPK